jgi:hypothetical protein
MPTAHGRSCPSAVDGKLGSEREAEIVGITVWSPFPKDTKYFEPSRASFMINYRVDNLDRLLQQLREAGVQVDSKISEEANGRFGWAVDDVWDSEEKAFSVERRGVPNGNS